MAEKSFVELTDDIIKVLKTIFDEEIPVNIYDLGLIYEVRVSPNYNAYIKMTLTSPNCPVAETIPGDVQSTVKAMIPELNNVDVELTFEPPWDKDMMSPEAQLELGFL